MLRLLCLRRGLFLLLCLCGGFQFHLVRLEHFGIVAGILDYVRHCGAYKLVFVFLQSEEAEQRGVLGLPHEIRHERFEGVLPFVELYQFA